MFRTHSRIVALTITLLTAVALNFAVTYALSPTTGAFQSHNSGVTIIPDSPKLQSHNSGATIIPDSPK
ncbi:MAG: hypothetical protein ACPL4I_08725 [Bacteroidota bacterium]